MHALERAIFSNYRGAACFPIEIINLHLPILPIHEGENLFSMCKDFALHTATVEINKELHKGLWIRLVLILVQTMFLR
jgi:hypothetical protein